MLRRSGAHKRCGEVEVAQISVWEGRVGQPESGERRVEEEEEAGRGWRARKGGEGSEGREREGGRLRYRPEGGWKHFKTR